MTAKEPDGVTGLPKETANESQQQLASELEAIAAKQLRGADGEDAVLFDQKQPETINNPNQLKVIEFERAVNEIQQHTMNAMVDFSQRAGMINTEVQGEEHLAVDAQFARFVQSVREEVIERVPEQADRCWKIGSDAREAELNRTSQLERLINDSKRALIEGGQRTLEALDGVKEAIKDGAEARTIDDLYRDVDNRLTDGLDYAEKNLANVPSYYGDVATIMDEMISEYSRLLKVADKPLDAEEEDRLIKILRARGQKFDKVMEDRATQERDRVKRLLKDMHEFYSDAYTAKIRRAFEELERASKPS